MGRVWSIPVQISEKRTVISDWDQNIRCVDTDSLETVWLFRTDAPVYSSAAVMSDGSFVIGCEDGKLRRISASGECLWAVKAGPFHGTPTIDSGEKTVYAGSFDRHMYALDTADGTVKWKMAFPSDPLDEGQDIYCSPALTDTGDIIFGTTLDLVCLSGAGVEKWRIRSRTFFNGTPALNYDFGTGLTGNSKQGQIYLFDYRTGAIVRVIETGGWVVNSAALSPFGTAVIGSDDGTLYGIDMKSCQVAWTRKYGTKYRYTPFTALPNGYALFPAADEKVHCVDMADGREVWALSMPNGAHSAPLVTPCGKMVVGSHWNTAYFFKW